MKRGDPIEIREIHNGVMISPALERHGAGIAILDKELIAFQSADEFIKWIKSHFMIYEQPNWDGEK